MRGYLLPRRGAPPPSDAGRLAAHDLTAIDANGFPLCLPVQRTELLDDGFRLTLGAGAPPVNAGPACLTMHAHPERFTGQENRTIIGNRRAVRIRLFGSTPSAPWPTGAWRAAGPASRSAFLTKGRRLAPRLASEAQRRFQAVPTVRLPDQP